MSTSVTVSAPEHFVVRVNDSSADRPFAAVEFDEIRIYPDGYGDTCFRQLLSWGEEMVRVARANLLPEPEGEFSPETSEPADAEDLF